MGSTIDPASLWRLVVFFVVLCIGGLVFTLLSTGVTAAQNVTALNHRITQLESDLAKAKIQRDAASREREAMALQLAPFETMAAMQVGGVPYQERLPVLLKRIEALTTAGAEAKGRRHLDADALARIKEALKDAPRIDVEVGGVLNDPESMNLAKELHGVFEQAGFQMRRLAEYTRPPTGFHGVSIYSKHELNEVLAGAVAELFKELSQPAVQWVEEQDIAAARAGEVPPELKIVVGSEAVIGDR